jgi:hypothetical protein
MESSSSTSTTEFTATDTTILPTTTLSVQTTPNTLATTTHLVTTTMVPMTSIGSTTVSSVAPTTFTPTDATSSTPAIVSTPGQSTVPQTTTPAPTTVQATTSSVTSFISTQSTSFTSALQSTSQATTGDGATESNITTDPNKDTTSEGTTEDPRLPFLESALSLLRLIEDEIETYLGLLRSGNRDLISVLGLRTVSNVEEAYEAVENSAVAVNNFEAETVDAQDVADLDKAAQDLHEANEFLASDSQNVLLLIKAHPEVEQELNELQQVTKAKEEDVEETIEDITHGVVTVKPPLTKDSHDLTVVAIVVSLALGLTAAVFIVVFAVRHFNRTRGGRRAGQPPESPLNPRQAHVGNDPSVILQGYSPQRKFE